MGQLYGFDIPMFVFTSDVRSDHCSSKPSFPKIVDDIDFPKKPTTLLNLILISAPSFHMRETIHSPFLLQCFTSARLSFELHLSYIVCM